MVELLKAPTAFRGPAQTYRNTDSGGRSSIQSNPTQSSPRKVNGVSGRTPTADAEGRACVFQVSPSGNLAWSRTQRCHHTTHPRSTQLYSHLSVLAGLLIECGEASPSPRRKPTYAWQGNNNGEPCERESSTTAAASRPPSHARTVSPRDPLRPIRRRGGPLRCTM